MLLTIDAGNTRTKWAIFDIHGEISEQHTCLNGELTQATLPPAVSGYDSVAISNVAGEQHASLLASKLSACNLPIHWLKAATQACGVFNRYTQPETLGSDRWAALIAAWNIKHAPCVVVNAGTAITIDALNTCEINHVPHGEFIGGLILPGLDLMQQSLGLATAQLPKFDANQNVDTQAPRETYGEIFAKNTADAVYAGALHAMIGAIRQMTCALKKESQQDPCIIVSGGNAQAIKDNLTAEMTNQAVIVDNLVLKGLYLINTP